LMAGAPQFPTLTPSPTPSWPLFTLGLLFILIGVLWHVFTARGLAARLLATQVAAEHENAIV
jgi:hypothetical protein